MLTQLRMSPPGDATKSTATIGSPLTATPWWSWLLRIGLGLYLLPVLLAVLLVGAVGMLLLDAGRRFTDLIGSQACHPQNTVGPDAFRS
jgi:hypothetical protein